MIIQGQFFELRKVGVIVILKTRVVLNGGNYSDSTNTCPTMSTVPTGGLTDNEHSVSSAEDHGVGLPNTAQFTLGKLEV